MESPEDERSIIGTRFKPDFRGLLVSLAINAGIPAVVVQVLIRRDVSLIVALAISAIFPVAYGAIGMVRSRRADFIALFSLFFIVIGIATSLASADVRLAIVKDSLGPALFGIICLSSLLAPRPLMFMLGRQFSTGNNPARQADWDSHWAFPYFRLVNRLITIVWGLASIADATLRVVLAYMLDPKLMALLSPLLSIITTLGLIVWTIAYTRHAGIRGAQIRRASEK